MKNPVKDGKTKKKLGNKQKNEVKPSLEQVKLSITLQKLINRKKTRKTTQNPVNPGKTR